MVQDERARSRAPMIKQALSLIEFSALTARQAEIRFNALDGSNSRPRALFKEDSTSSDSLDIQKYAGENIYFGGLECVDETCAPDVRGMLEDQNTAKPGALVWNLDVA